MERTMTARPASQIRHRASHAERFDAGSVIPVVPARIGANDAEEGTS
jgi:hypothetical protein